jgi:hypothetical protein
MAGKIIADIIEAPYDSIRMNVANVTVLTANNSGLTYVPTGNVNINIGSTASLTLGNVTVSNLITANGGIKFPATQVASGDANTLDDYEEGTWTPTVVSTGGGTPTYNALNVGAYTKIGRQVNLQFVVFLDSKGTLNAGTVSIGNLPFSRGSTASGSRFLIDFFWQTSGTNMIYVLGTTSVSDIALFKITAATNDSTGAQLTVGDIGTAIVLLRGQITYFV